MIELRPYQIEISEKAAKALSSLKIIYLAMEVRTGKTFTALNCAKIFGAKKVLFLTKKKAIKSIEKDYIDFAPKFKILVTNYENLHNVNDTDFDLLICDESHCLSAFPKPSQRTENIKNKFGYLPIILLSGTPEIESISQWYHQFWISENSPFKSNKNFYSWFKTYGLILTQISRGNGLKSNNYKSTKEDIIGYFSLEKRKLSKQDAFYNQKLEEIEKNIKFQLALLSEAEKNIKSVIAPYLFTYTQKEAGFNAEIKEHILYFTPQNITLKLIKQLLKDKVIEGKSQTIMADTPVKLRSKIHQIANGTIIFESKESQIIDTSKADFVKQKFAGQKIAIFYFFQKELELLKSVFGNNLTTDLDEFNNSNKNIALQQSAGAEGISLKNAEALIFYNFGYSGSKYMQSRDRMTTKEREHNNVYFIFYDRDINSRIYEALKTKKTYSEKTFIKDFRVK